jgi:agmatinase
VTAAPHFLDIPAEVAADPSCPCAVLPVPYERTTTFGKGTAAGPDAILRASHETEDFDDELRVPLDLKVQTLPVPHIGDAADEQALSFIRAAAADVFAKQRFLLALGGEHTITSPLVAAATNVFEPLTVLCLDAHLDLRDTYQDSPRSHACALRRVRDQGVRTVHAGVRSSSAAEYAYACEHDVPVIWARDRGARDALARDVLRHLEDPVYISIDVDVFDPSLVPGTGTPEPGGLTWDQVTGLLRQVFRRCTVIGADIVELAPVPGSVVSEFVAAKLGQKLLTYKCVDSMI